MRDKAKIAVVLLTVLLVVLPLACKPIQRDPNQLTTGSNAPVLGQTPEQKVLDQFLGTWSMEATAFKAKGTPVEKHTTGTYSVTRILGGRFNQQTGEDSEGNSMIALSTYDQQRKCYRSWGFGSNYGGPEAPSNGKWNEATRTMDMGGPGNDGQTSVGQTRFLNDDTTISILKINDAAGEVLINMEFKMTRMKGPQNSNQPATATSAPVLGLTAEQRVLDRLLGTWDQETTEFKAKWTPNEKHTPGRFTFTRVLGGRFVQETGEDAEKNSCIILYTYDEQRKCYRCWVFGSGFGGPMGPSSAKCNEATRTLEYFSFPENEGQRPASQMRFVSDGEVVSTYMVQDTARETLFHAEYKMTRMKGPQN